MYQGGPIVPRGVLLCPIVPRGVPLCQVCPTVPRGVLLYLGGPIVPRDVLLYEGGPTMPRGVPLCQGGPIVSRGVPLCQGVFPCTRCSGAQLPHTLPHSFPFHRGSPFPHQLVTWSLEPKEPAGSTPSLKIHPSCIHTSVSFCLNCVLTCTILPLISTSVQCVICIR